MASLACTYIHHHATYAGIDILTLYETNGIPRSSQPLIKFVDRLPGSLSHDLGAVLLPLRLRQKSLKRDPLIPAVVDQPRPRDIDDGEVPGRLERERPRAPRPREARVPNLEPVEQRRVVRERRVQPRRVGELHVAHRLARAAREELRHRVAHRALAAGPPPVRRARVAPQARM
ncbi:unnamed protein product, partial [Mycena citricolor]